MYRSFTSLDGLFAHMKADKECDGAESTIRNRYPVRFVLFENFADFNDFVAGRSDSVFSIAITQMLEMEHPDIFPTFTDLSREIAARIRALPTSDYIIFPFSELTRFYREDEFRALVMTMKGMEPSAEAQEKHMRIYVPIVGMQGKMTDLINDPQAFVWEYKSGAEGGLYHLIISGGGSYGVKSLEGRFTAVASLVEWLDLWKQGPMVSRDIVCTSPRIAMNALNARPDNAFAYTDCHNAYEFLTAGLGLDFGDSAAEDASNPMWEELASRIDISDFDFTRFAEKHFGAGAFASPESIVEAWFRCTTDFHRWLLVTYLKASPEIKGYVRDVFCECRELTTPMLFADLTTRILDIRMTDEELRQRREALAVGSRRNVNIPDMAEQRYAARLSTMLAGSPEEKYHASRILTDFTASERRLAIDALAKGTITMQDIRRIYPALFSYMAPLAFRLPQRQQWIAGYFDAYRRAKIANNDHAVAPLIDERNASPASFHAWADEFKTVKTILHNRPDIDTVYWIDGLGVDWVPFIADIIARHSIEKVWLNEIIIARAELPTTTSVNKAKLEELIPAGSRLEKVADLDELAHSTRRYPEYIIGDLEVLEKRITDVLAHYNNRKIAFVSDHGLTYMAQYGRGLGLAGFHANHEGRTGEFADKPVADNRYIILDDSPAVCALSHDSLGAKTPSGHGAHGGATPEEVLVPVIIVSPQQNATSYSVELLTEAVDSTNPVVRLSIRGLASVDCPAVTYNGADYPLTCTGDDTYETPRLDLTESATKITVAINGVAVGEYTLRVSTGAEENNLLDEFLL